MMRDAREWALVRCRKQRVVVVGEVWVREILMDSALTHEQGVGLRLLLGLMAQVWEALLLVRKASCLA